MNIEKNLLITKNKISYRKNDYPCNCCYCPTSNCHCPCYCKCHIQTFLLPIDKKNNVLINFYTEDALKNKEKKLNHHNSESNIISLVDLKENNEKENINNSNNDEIIKSQINLIPKIKKKFKNKTSTNSSLIKQKFLNNKKTQIEFKKLINNMSENNSNKNTNINHTHKENENISNNDPFFNEVNYNTFHNCSKLENKTDRNYNYKNKKIVNNSSLNNNNYLLYFLTNENFYNHKKKKTENMKTKQKFNINDKKEKTKNLDNNLINNYIFESKRTRIPNNNDLRDILHKYESKKKIKKNKNFGLLQVSSFDFSFINNGLNNKENEKLIKIYEKKIQQLEQKLYEANEKIENLTKISINNKTDILQLKDELKQKDNKLVNKAKKNNSCNILGRNNDSLIIKLPENFKKFKMDKDSSFTDDNSFNKTNINNQYNSYGISQNTSIFNDCKIYKKKKYSKIYKKVKGINRTLSQPNLSEIYTLDNINVKSKENKSKDEKIIKNKKIIYTIYPSTNGQKLLAFDLISKNYSFQSFNKINFDDFDKNYAESFRQEESQYNSISLFHENILYIVTGKNSDIFYKYEPNHNTIDKICNLKNNHANGVLIHYKDKIVCLSGKYNKKVEVFYGEKKQWEEINEMNIERSFFSVCITHERYIFCLFGYNTPTNKYLDSIEFCDMSYLYYDKDKINWKYLKYKNYNMINMNICGFVSINYKDEKIIIFGGLNGVEKKPVNKFFQLILDKNKNFGKDNDNTYIEEANRNSNNIYKNKCYYFNNGFAQFDGNDEKRNSFYVGFDNNYNVHFMEINDKLIHDVYFFNK